MTHEWIVNSGLLYESEVETLCHSGLDPESISLPGFSGYRIESGMTNHFL